MSLVDTSSEDKKKQTPFQELVDLYDRYGGEKYMIQEEITQYDHALQSAYIALLCGAPDEIIIGLLYHDIGQLTNKTLVGKADKLHGSHAEIGGEWMYNRGFPEVVCDLVKYHALAKCILCVDDSKGKYFNNLSLASKISFGIQIKKYSKEDFAKFRKIPYASDILYARKCDDMAKITKFSSVTAKGSTTKDSSTLPSFDFYEGLVNKVFSGRYLKYLPYNNYNQNASSQKWKENVDKFYNMMSEDRTKFETYIQNLKPAFTDFEKIY